MSARALKVTPLWWVYVKQIVPVLVVLSLVGWGVQYWYFNIHKKDGVTCERDVHCPHRVCIRDIEGFYCSRRCSGDGECLEGWRCVRPPGEPGRGPSCVRP